MNLKFLGLNFSFCLNQFIVFFQYFLCCLTLQKVFMKQEPTFLHKFSSSKFFSSQIHFDFDFIFWGRNCSIAFLFCQFQARSWIFWLYFKLQSRWVWKMTQSWDFKTNLLFGLWRLSSVIWSWFLSFWCHNEVLNWAGLMVFLSTCVLWVSIRLLLRFSHGLNAFWL